MDSYSIHFGKLEIRFDLIYELTMSFVQQITFSKNINSNENTLKDLNNPQSFVWRSLESKYQQKQMKNQVI